MGTAWNRVKVEERGRSYVDHVREDGAFRLAEGHDNDAARDGRPWTLLARDRGYVGGWRFVATHATLADGKAGAT